MKFEKLLTDRGLAKEDLSKGIQKKIKEVTDFQAKLETLNPDNLNEEDKVLFKDVMNDINQLDKELVVLIKKFDPEKYKRQVQNVMEQRAGKKAMKLAEENKNAGNAPPKQQQEPPPPNDPVPPVPEAPLPPPPVKPVEAEEAIEGLMKQSTIAPMNGVKPEEFKQTVEETVEQQYTPAEEIPADEYAKKAEVKPKKMSVSFIMMGVGAFLLTWGAVNVLKERNS